MKAALLERLNSGPYNLSLQLSDLGAAKGSDLLTICDAVTRSITDPTCIDSSRSTSLDRTEDNNWLDRTITLLSTLGFKEMNDAENQEFFRRGDSSIVLSALEFITTQPAELLKKRHYLAQYLLPLILPEELHGDDDVNTRTNALLHVKRYQDLQNSFKTTHQNYSALQKEATAFNEVQDEIEQLETERTQLIHRIDSLRNQASKSEPGSFDRILQATTEMRCLQEKEIRQQRNLEETSDTFESITADCADTERRLTVLERCSMLSSSDGDEKSPTVESILECLARDAHEFSINIRSDLALSHHRASERLNEFSSESEPTDDAFYALKDRVGQLEEEINQKRAAIEGQRGTGRGTGGGVDMFVNYNSEAAMNLAASEASLEKKRKDVLRIEAVTNELKIEAGKSVSIEPGDQKEAKQKASKMESDIASLRRTEQLLRNQLVQESRLNDTEGRGHGGVADGAASHELKERRAMLLDLEGEHKEKRERYERLSMRFATDRQTLQDEVNMLEKEWMSIDSSRENQEQSNEKAEAAMKQLDDFESVAAGYAKDLAHNESVLSQLRGEKRTIEAQYSPGSMQCDLFAKVERLLRLQKQSFAEEF